MADTLDVALDRLENFYDFQCQGGALKDCKDWLRLKGAVLCLRTMVFPPPLTPTQPRLREGRPTRPDNIPGIQYEGAKYLEALEAYCTALEEQMKEGK